MISNTQWMKAEVSNTSALVATPKQDRAITGKVVDINGEALIGVNIIEKGTTNGTITDIDGNFTLGKHPRKLQFKVDNLIIEVRSNEKERIHLNSDEIVSVKMSIYKNRIVLQNWLAFQYRRHAIDSKINEIFKKIGLRDIAKKYLSNLIGIWLDITDDDFENDYIYLSAYFVFDVDMPNIVQHEQQLKEIIGSKLEKIKLKKEQLIIFCFYENDFSLYQARNLMFLNFDYLSGY